MTYKDAKAECNQAGGVLAKLNSQEAIDTALLLLGPDPKNAWFGLDRLRQGSVHGVFRWLEDGTDLDETVFEDWCAPSPNREGRCVMLNAFSDVHCLAQGNTWNDVSCEQTLRYAICRRLSL